MEKYLKYLMVPHYLLYPAVLVLGITLGVQYDVAGMSAWPDGMRNFLQPARYGGPPVGEKDARIEWAHKSADGVNVLKDKLFGEARERILLANCELNSNQRLLLAKATDRGVRVNLVVSSANDVDLDWLKTNRVSAVAAKVGVTSVIIVDQKTVAVGNCAPTSELDSVLTIWNSPATVNAYVRRFESAWNGGRVIHQRQEIR